MINAFRRMHDTYMHVYLGHVTLRKFDTVIFLWVFAAGGAVQLNLCVFIDETTNFDVAWKFESLVVLFIERLPFLKTCVAVRITSRQRYASIGVSWRF